ncbi:MAG: hypothetical protein Q7T79_03300 [bacterium]|nr:hypothetical protein [bacterium]
MKENKKSFSELTKSLQPLEENQEGMLKGGFASLSSSSESILPEINGFGCGKTNTNCQGGNCVAGCGGTAPQ